MPAQQNAFLLTNLCRVFLDTWLGTHALTMSLDLMDILGEPLDFASGKEAGSFCKGFLWREKEPSLKDPFL